METGNIPAALMQADKLIVARRLILGQVVFASVFPSALALLSAGLLLANNMALVPTLSKMSDPARWTGALGLMNGVAQWTEVGCDRSSYSRQGVILAFWSLPRWRGRLRVFDFYCPGRFTRICGGSVPDEYRCAAGGWRAGA
jgi:hypothetical protein